MVSIVEDLLYLVVVLVEYLFVGVVVVLRRAGGRLFGGEGNGFGLGGGGAGGYGGSAGVSWFSHRLLQLKCMGTRVYLQMVPCFDLRMNLRLVRWMSFGCCWSNHRARSRSIRREEANA